MREDKIRIMLEAEKELVKDLKPEEKFKYYLSRMQYVKYVGGKENFMRSDCSGSICLALLLATGYSIRVTADDLMRKYFTVKNPLKNTIQAAFFTTHYDRRLGNRLYKEGECAHVAGVCGDGVVLNCVEPRAYLRSLNEMRLMYQAMDYSCEVRGLNIEALKAASEAGKDLFGADPEFLIYKDAVSEDKV